MFTDPGTTPVEFDPEKLPDELKLTYNADFDEQAYDEAKAVFCDRC